MLKTWLYSLHWPGKRNLSAEIRVICVYRYFSLGLTSIFYLAGMPNSSWENKLTVAGCLAVAALISNYIYVKYESAKKVVKIIIAVETVSNIIILIPTGGLKSPYIWYSLNTVLNAAYFLNIYYFCFNLLAYTTILTMMSFYLFNPSEKSMAGFLWDNSNLILSYTLIIFAVQLLMKLAKKLQEESTRLSLANRELTEANRLVGESMEYVASLYRTIHNFINIRNTGKFADVLVKYVRKITKTRVSFLCMHTEKGEYILKVSEDVPDNFKSLLNEYMKGNWENIVNGDEPVRFVLDGRELAAAPLKSSHEIHGVLGIEIKNETGGIIERENLNQVKFLASLSAIVFERSRTEEMNRLLLISEEQNRIANEIHDSVCQRLFYVSCKVNSLMKTNGAQNGTEFKSEINLIKESLGKAMKELRETIYSYSRSRKGLSAFEENIGNYISEVSRLNEVNISFNLIGHQELINDDLKKAIYRILCEGMGNAIRHGKSKNLNICLCVEKDCVKLGIEDDGVGFDLKSSMLNKSMGLGINNLYSLANSFNGDITINSQLGKGTSVSVVFPGMYGTGDGQEEVI